MKEQKVLDKFCRKLVAMDMDIFGLRGMAKDADPNKKSDWITMNGTPVFVGEGETPKEAGKRFAAKKESERASSSPIKNDDNDWVHPDTYSAANPEYDDEENWTHEDPWANYNKENSSERRKLHSEENPSNKGNHTDFPKSTTKEDVPPTYKNGITKGGRILITNGAKGFTIGELSALRENSIALMDKARKAMSNAEDEIKKFKPGDEGYLKARNKYDANYKRYYQFARDLSIVEAAIERKNKEGQG